MAAYHSDMPTPHLSAHVDVFFEHEGHKSLVQTSRRCPICLSPLTGPVIARASGGKVHASCAKRLPAYAEHIVEVPSR